MAEAPSEEDNNHIEANISEQASIQVNANSKQSDATQATHAGNASDSTTNTRSTCTVGTQSNQTNDDPTGDKDKPHDDTLQVWAKTCGLSEKTINILAAEEFLSMDDLSYLEEDDLAILQLPLAQKKRLVKALQQLHTPATDIQVVDNKRQLSQDAAQNDISLLGNCSKLGQVPDMMCVAASLPGLRGEGRGSGTVPKESDRRIVEGAAASPDNQERAENPTRVLDKRSHISQEASLNDVSVLDNCTKCDQVPVVASLPEKDKKNDENRRNIETLTEDNNTGISEGAVALPQGPKDEARKRTPGRTESKDAIQKWGKTHHLTTTTIQMLTEKFGSLMSIRCSKKSDIDQSCVSKRQGKCLNKALRELQCDQSHEPVQRDPFSVTSKKTSSVHLVKKCQKMRGGHPSVYKLPLRTKHHSDKYFTRTCTLDIDNAMRGQIEKTIMIVGATGAGKSTLIDGMINYILNVHLEDDFRFQLIDLSQSESEKRANQDQSQTEYVTAYKIPRTRDSLLDYNLTIIDTPGFGDVRGIKRDKFISEQIRDFFTSDEAILTLHAVCFVTQAPSARLTPTQRYVFDSVLSLFGKDIEENILAMITFADGAKPPALAALQAAKMPYQESFKFNNSALFEENTNKTDIFQSTFWNIGKNNFENFFIFLHRLPMRSLRITKDVLQERQRLETTVEGLRPQIRKGLSHMSTLRQEEAVMKQHEDLIKANKDFTYEVTVPKTKKVTIPPGTYITNCMKCNRTCHKNCRIPNDDQKYRCSSMRESYCVVCPEKCHWTQHVNQQFIYEDYIETERRTYEAIKKNFEKAKEGQRKGFTVITFVKNLSKSTQDGVNNMMSQVRHSVERLDVIALRPDPMSDVDYIGLMIEAEKNEASPGFEERLRELEEVKKSAELVHNAKNENYDPLLQNQHL